MGPVLLGFNSKEQRQSLGSSRSLTVTHLPMLFPINEEASGIGKLILALGIVPHVPFSF